MSWGDKLLGTVVILGLLLLGLSLLVKPSEYTSHLKAKNSDLTRELRIERQALRKCRVARDGYRLRIGMVGKDHFKETQ